MDAEQKVNVVEEARKRRATAAIQTTIRTEWFIDQVAHHVARSLQQRVLLATEFLKNRIIVNISRPVTKKLVTSYSGRKEVRVSNRSKAGEFPKADTTQLMKTIFSDYKELEEGLYDGYVGTPLDYGLWLELKMDRSFLVRTLQAELSKLKAILSGPLE